MTSFDARALHRVSAAAVAAMTAALGCLAFGIGLALAAGAAAAVGVAVISTFPRRATA